jgi:membrane protease YdiL (CAAX protease family)
MVRTRSLWACVVAHGVTNLLLGLYVVYSGDWFLM